jgi:NAD(P)-dependent dehydrogenase (short-subunit alcohol dehydrogenase family)
MSAPSVLVTGGSRGIGRAIALRFAREGSRVVVASRNSAQLDAVVAEIEAAGGQGLAAQMNVRDHGSVEAAVWRAVEFCGGALDLLVNNAGVFDVLPFGELDVATWRKNVEVHLDGTFYVTKECLDALLESGRGHIVNMASVAARQAFAGNVAYCATKFGLRGFSDALRLDLAPHGIRVTTVYPGPTDTTIFEGVPGDWDPATMNRPEDVAEVVWQAWSSPPAADVADLDVPPPGA